MVLDGPGGVEANGTSALPSISSDGTRVAFESFASNLVANDTNVNGDIFVRDRTSGTTVRASEATGGFQSLSRSQGASLSPDGGYVAFYSPGADLVSGDANGARDVFLRRLSDATTIRVSVPLAGGEGDGGSLHPTVGPAADRVVFFHEGEIAVNTSPDKAFNQNDNPDLQKFVDAVRF